MLLEVVPVMLSVPARALRLALLYTALVVGANAVQAADPAALLEGDMRKLSFHAEPRAVPAIAVTDPDGAEHLLADWQGQWVVLNFWATWCAPCRHEMPALDRLQQQLGGAEFAVVPVATGRNPVPAIRRFFDEIAVESLPILLDPTQRLSREMGVFGLPVTVILNPAGQEVARMTGDATWDSPSAKAMLTALIAGEG